MWAVPTKGGPNSTESNVGGHWLEICKLILEFIFWRITDFILPDKTNKKFNYFCAKILMEIKDFCWETDSDATPQSHALLTEDAVHVLTKEEMSTKVLPSFYSPCAAISSTAKPTVGIRVHWITSVLLQLSSTFSKSVALQNVWQ